MTEDATFLMYPRSYPDEGEMIVVSGRSGVEEALATKMVFGEQSLADLTCEHRRELDALMERFDDPDEWTGPDLCWSFEDGAIQVTRLDPSIAVRMSLTRTSAKLRGILTKAAEQFEFYAREHSAKANAATARNALGDADIAMSKARTNTAYAEMCRAALSPHGTGEEKQP